MGVVVVTGAGGMGLACARRVGNGRKIVLADVNREALSLGTESLESAGFEVLSQVVDVSSDNSVQALAAFTKKVGELDAVIHTAGLSPTMATSERIYAVDMLGTALMIDAFQPLAVRGSVAVIVASIASAWVSISPEVEHRLARAPAGDLLHAIGSLHANDPGSAYAVAKRGNQLRVEASAAAWGARGARIVSISPGLIHTPMQKQEERLNPRVAALKGMVPVGRYGTPEDIAAAVEWLIGPSASLVNGVDLRIDGGLVSNVRWSGDSFSFT